MGARCIVDGTKQTKKKSGARCAPRTASSPVVASSPQIVIPESLSSRRVPALKSTQAPVTFASSLFRPGRKMISSRVSARQSQRETSRLSGSAYGRCFAPRPIHLLRGCRGRGEEGLVCVCVCVRGREREREMCSRPRAY